MKKNKTVTAVLLLAVERTVKSTRSAVHRTKHIVKDHENTHDFDPNHHFNEITSDFVIHMQVFNNCLCT